MTGPAEVTGLVDVIFVVELIVLVEVILETPIETAAIYIYTSNQKRQLSLALYIYTG